MNIVATIRIVTLELKNICFKLSCRFINIDINVFYMFINNSSKLSNYDKTNQNISYSIAYIIVKSSEYSTAKSQCTLCTRNVSYVILNFYLYPITFICQLLLSFELFFTMIATRLHQYKIKMVQDAIIQLIKNKIIHVV